MNNNWLYKLNRKYGRYAIHNLILYIVIGQAVVFAFDFILGSAGISLSDKLQFDVPLIMSGQAWRIISFIFVPPVSWFLLFTLLAMYFTWLIGSSLENEWGAFKFNLFYLTGVIGTIIGGFITKSTTSVYLNLSMFLAFASLFPDFQILLFFIIPIKVKYLAWVDAFFLLASLITSPWPIKVAVLVSVLNLILYFWPQITQRVRQWRRRSQWKRNLR